MTQSPWCRVGMTMGVGQTPRERVRSCLLILLFCVGVTAVLLLTVDRLERLTLVHFLLVLAVIAAGSAVLWKIGASLDRRLLDRKPASLVVWPLLLWGAGGFYFCFAAVVWRIFAWLWP